MEAAGGGATPQFMSTHPSSSTRIKQLQKDIPAVKATYGSAAAAAGLSSGSSTSTSTPAKSTSTKKSNSTKKSTGFKIG